MSVGGVSESPFIVVLAALPSRYHSQLTLCAAWTMTASYMAAGKPFSTQVRDCDRCVDRAHLEHRLPIPPSALPPPAPDTLPDRHPASVLQHPICRHCCWWCMFADCMYSPPPHTHTHARTHMPTCASSLYGVSYVARPSDHRVAEFACSKHNNF